MKQPDAIFDGPPLWQGISLLLGAYASRWFFPKFLTYGEKEMLFIFLLALFFTFLLCRPLWKQPWFVFAILTIVGIDLGAWALQISSVVEKTSGPVIASLIFGAVFMNAVIVYIYFRAFVGRPGKVFTDRPDRDDRYSF